MTAPPPATALAGQPPQRRRVTVRGVVQGVGFRPFLYALATGLELAGHVTNTGEGVVAEVEGDPSAVALFCDRITVRPPPLAQVESVDHQEIPTSGGAGFTIIASGTGGPARTLVSPDMATCADCVAELTDPADRRYRHPFITCTHCGPRFTIVTALPYDRAHTTMAGFPMCADCAREYADPADRRFHAQPIACPACGPRLRLLVATTPPAGPPGRPGRPPAPTRSPPPANSWPGARSWPSRASAATTWPATPPTRAPWPSCAAARPVATSRSP